MTNYVNSVQQVTITIASGALTGTATVTAAVDTFFLVYQGNTTAAAANGKQGFCYVTISGNTITATRGVTGTACTVRVAVVDATASLVKSVQMGTITNTGSPTSSTATISAVTTTNAAVHLLGFQQSDTVFNFTEDIPILSLTNATTVTASSANGSNGFIAGYLVVEFQPAALQSSTQAVASSFNNTSTTTNAVTITSVTAGNAMIFYAGSQGQATSIRDQQTAQLTNGTTVTITSGFTVGDTVLCHCTVVEFVAAALAQSVQRGTIALSAATSATATITSSATSNTLCNYLGFQGSSSQTTNLAVALPNLTQTSATVITAALNTAGTLTVNFEAVQFTAATVSIPMGFYPMFPDMAPLGLFSIRAY